MSEFTWPAWLVGTPSQFALLIIALVALIKVWPILQRNILDAKERRESRYSARITHLEQAVKECHSQCEEQKNGLRVEVRRLEELRLSDRAQNLQEQISLVSILVKNVDNPLLDRILQSLQARSIAEKPRELTGVVGDAYKGGK